MISAVVLFPAGASASTISVSPPSDPMGPYPALFQTGPGEVSDLTTTSPGTFTLSAHDAGAPLTAGVGCTPGDPVLCSPVTSFSAVFGAGADRADITTAVPETVFGNDGDDTIRTRTTGSTAEVHGGAGKDTIIASANSAVTVDGDLGADKLAGSSNSGVVTLRGGTGDDVLLGRNLGTVLDGGAGEDIVVGRGYFNTLQGGDGADTLVGDAAARPGAYPGSIDAGRNNDVVAFTPNNGVPWTIATGDGQDRIYASGRGDTINAGPGSDKVYAANGVHDDVDCGTDSDSVYADPGDTVSNCEVVTRAPAKGTDDRVADILARVSAATAGL